MHQHRPLQPQRPQWVTITTVEGELRPAKVTSAATVDTRVTDGTSKVTITTIDKRPQDSLILKPRDQMDTEVKDPQKVLSIMTNLK